MIEIIQERLKRYTLSNAIEEENATREIFQEIALYGLWQADFFDAALFQGETSLRILYQLPRFSEDLDFLLRTPDPDFKWSRYLQVLVEVFEQFGIHLEATPKEKMDGAIRQAVLKDNSIANQLDLTFAGGGRRHKTIKVKLEVDTNPPALSGEATTFLDFPADYQVRHQDMASNFALKIHALLCRGFVKGRDWFDFSWYVAKSVQPNLAHLQAALMQKGPWENTAGLVVDWPWLEDALTRKINAIEWPEAAEDVRRFLRPAEQKSLALWGAAFFLSRLKKLAEGRD